MPDRIPDEVIYAALRDLDDPGEQAADWFLCGFAQAQSGSARAGNLVAYSGREALMALLALGGVRPSGLGDAVDAVLAVAQQVSAEGPGDQVALFQALGALKEQRDGPGPHRHRLGALIFEMTQRRSVEIKRDLFDRYVETLEALNGLVHSGARASLEDAKGLLDDAFAIVGRLFAPISQRFDAIDTLVALEIPTPEDASQLLGWHGDPRMLSYFFSRVKSLGWFEALADHELLRPPKELGFWPALVYLRGLGESHPHQVKEWLGRQSSGRDLTTQQALHFLQLARSVQAPIDSELLQLLKGHFANQGVLQLLSVYLEGRPSDGQQVGATFGLVKEALDGVATGDSFGGGGYLVGVLLRRVVSLAEKLEPVRWLSVICAKTRNLFGPNEAMGFWAIQRLQPIPRLHIDAGSQVLEQFAAAIRDLLRVAERAGASAQTRHAKLRTLPAPLAARFVAADLLAAEELDVPAALALLSEQAAGADAMPETLALVRRLRDLDLDGFADTMSTALGDPPAVEVVEGLGETEEIPRRWAVVFGWSDAMPTRAIDGWRPAIEICRARWGEPNTNGAVLPPPVAAFRTKESPYPEDELKDLPALKAAVKVAQWAPDPANDFGPSRHGLATVLKEVIEADRGRWMSTTAPKIVWALARPVYLLSYFGAVASGTEETLPIAVLAAMEEAAKLYTRSLGGQVPDFDGPPWSSVWITALPLLARLDLTENKSRERAWSLLSDLADPNEQGSGSAPTVYAAALSAAIGIADASASDDEPPAEFEKFLDAALLLRRPLGESVRSALGANLSWLVSRFPSWTDQHWNELVGGAAVDDLGAYTFERYLERGRPFAALLRRCRDQIWAAMATTPATARVHILHGMLWGLDEYVPHSVVDDLSAVSGAAVSDAAQWLAFAVARSPEIDVAPIWAFWQTAIRANLQPAQYEGFGHFATAEQLDTDAWLDVSLVTARLCSSGLALPDQIANRASEYPDDARALRIISAVLASRIELWQMFEVGRAGVAILQTTQSADTEAKSELRERLLEREFYEVRIEH